MLYLVLKTLFFLAIKKRKDKRGIFLKKYELKVNKAASLILEIRILKVNK